MAMILPKGIVVNNPDIEGQIERIAREPLAGEEIAKFWKVYTTTKRRLLDPTAERLENYWWRIWGSRKRDLDGATVARLFAEISDGESFVPLRSPANRDEGIPPPRRTQPGPVASSSSTTALPDVQNGTQSTISSPATSKAPIVMPPPILKKSRGPSTSGPRPTARFVSPHDSGEDPDPISPNAHVIVQPPSPDSLHLKVEKKAAMGPTVNGKKKGQAFVASTAANKKRPVIVRRPSSQTSQPSTDSASRAFISAQQLAESETSLKRAPPSVPVRKDSALGDIQSEINRKEKLQAPIFHENLSPSPTTPFSKKPSQLSGDSTSASLVLLRKSTSGASKQVNGFPVEPAPERAPAGEPGPSTVMQKIENGQTPVEELALEEQEEIELQRLLLKEAKRNQHEPSHKTSPSSSKSEVQILHKSSRSNSDGVWKADMEAVRLLPGDVKSTVGLASVPIAGELTTEAITKDLPRSASRKVDKGKGRDPEELAAIGEGSGSNGMFAKRPVQPISDVPANSSGISQPSKSKSQLTLLLEKDRARTDEHKKEEKKRGRSKDDKGKQKK